MLQNGKVTVQSANWHFGTLPVKADQ